MLGGIILARKVFFSFHYDNDVNRARVVRNSWVIRGKSSAGFIDKAEFEEIKRKGKSAVERWIDSQLSGTSVTVVLIGKETLSRPFVQYEIIESYKKGNPIIGIGIGKIKDMRIGLTSSSQSIHTTIGTYKGRNLSFSELMSGYYDYISDDGYTNLGKWVEEAKVKILR